MRMGLEFWKTVIKQAFHTTLNIFTKLGILCFTTNAVLHFKKAVCINFLINYLPGALLQDKYIWGCIISKQHYLMCIPLGCQALLALEENVSACLAQWSLGEFELRKLKGMQHKLKKNPKT